MKAYNPYANCSKHLADKGWTVIYTRWDDGQVWVAGRFKTVEEKDAFLEKIHSPDSGWTPEEINSICVINDYNYRLN